MNYRTHVRPKYVDLMHAMGMVSQFHRAEGYTLYTRDASGAEVAVLDCLGGYGAALFGHNPPALVDEARAMLDAGVPFHAQLSVRGEAGELAAELNAALNAEQGDRQHWIATFSNSGAEAVEIAIKHAEYARHHRLEETLAGLDNQLHAIESAQAWREVELAGLDLPPGLLPAGLDRLPLARLCEALRRHNLETARQRPVFIALRHSFHGKLVNTVQLTHGKQYREAYGRFGLAVEFLDPTQPERLDAIAARHAGHWLSLAVEADGPRLLRTPCSAITGVLVEPIQGEGGIRPLSPETALALRRFCNTQGCPLIVDEVQSGFGRSGQLLAGTAIGLRGDTLCLSKALGGSLAKIAVTLVRAEQYQEDFSFTHSSTFAEDDFGCRIARRALQLLLAEEGAMLAAIRERGQALLDGLRRLQAAYPDVIADVRGRGLLLGIELHDLSRSGSVVYSSAQYNEALGYLIGGYLLQQERIRVAPSASNPNVLRLEPPACIDAEGIARVLEAMERVCTMLRRRDALPIAASICADRVPRTLPDPAAPTPDPAPPAQPGPVPRVAFVNHLIDTDMLSEVEPSLSALAPEHKRLFVQRMAPERRSAPIGPVRIRSRLGQAVDFTLYPLCTDSDTMTDCLQGEGLERMRREIAERVGDARGDGSRVAGLGMYTSILTNNCQSIEMPGIALTSGNALTIGMGIEAIRRSCAERGIELAQATAAVVGAAGNIASTYAGLLSEQVGRLWLLGSGREGSPRRLARTAARIHAEAARALHAGRDADDLLARRIGAVPGVRDLVDAHIDATDLGERVFAHLEATLGEHNFVRVAVDTACLREAQIVVCAANAPRAFLGADDFAPQAVVCDIAVPLNVDQDLPAQRPDIAYLHGGIVRTPMGDGLPPHVRAYLGEGELYACMAESVLMGLSGMREHYSYGDIDRDQVRRMLALAHAHGFGLGGIKTANSL